MAEQSTTTAAPAQTTSTATQAPAPAVTASTTPPAPGATAATGPLGRPKYVPPPATQTTEAKAASSASQAATEASKEPAAPPAAEKPSEMAEALAKLNREAREARATREKFEAEHKTLSEKVKQAEVIEQARKLLEADDVLGAIRALGTQKNIDELTLRLFEQTQQEDARPLSPQEVAELAAKEIERKQAESKAAEEKAAHESLAKAKAMYGDACQQVLSQNVEKYGLVAALGISDAAMDAYVMQHRQENGSVPAPADLLQHFNDELEANLKRAGYTRAQIAKVEAGQAPAPTVAGAAVANTGGAAATKDERPLSLAEQRARVRAQLIAMHAQH